MAKLIDYTTEKELFLKVFVLRAQYPISRGVRIIENSVSIGL